MKGEDSFKLLEVFLCETGGGRAQEQMANILTDNPSQIKDWFAVLQFSEGLTVS